MNKINNQNLFCFHKNNLKEKRINQIYRHFIFLLIHIFFNLLKEAHEQLQINVIVNKLALANINKYVINDEFYKQPDNVLIGSSNNQLNLYNTTIIFDSFIVSCVNMFNGITNIVEIDL